MPGTSDRNRLRPPVGNRTTHTITIPLPPDQAVDARDQRQIVVVPADGTTPALPSSAYAEDVDSPELDSLELMLLEEAAEGSRGGVRFVHPL